MAQREADSPLAWQVAEQLKNYIIEHELGPNDRLPTELSMASSLTVARSTVREAIRILQSQNIVYARHGSGTFVAAVPGVSQDPLGLDFIRDRQKLTRDLLEIRGVIEPAIAEMAARNATDEDIEELDRLCRNVELCVMEGRDFIEDDLEFHQKLAESSGNDVAMRLVPIIHESVELFTRRTDYQLLQETLDTHRGLVEAIRARDPVLARDAMVLHNAYNRRLLLDIERRELGIDDHVPVVTDEVKKRWKREQ